jgi:hypothetical protein
MRRAVCLSRVEKKSARQEDRPGLLRLVKPARRQGQRRRGSGRLGGKAGQANSFLFKQPVSVGDVVSFYGEIVETGRTSIKVNVEVYAERNPTDPVIVKVTEATLTYVAITQQGVKRELPDVHKS